MIDAASNQDGCKAATLELGYTASGRFDVMSRPLRTVHRADRRRRALAIPAGGIAYAYWTRRGIGAGAGDTGTLSALSLTPGSPGATLYPGGQPTSS